MTYALITGASKGIGLSMAHALASRKYNLLLIARSEEELAKVAGELSAKWQVKVDYLALDLSGLKLPQRYLTGAKRVIMRFPC
jgi:uncharacterized protein